MPITIQFGAQTSLSVEAHSLTEDGAALEHCVYDAADYPGNGDADETAAAIGTMRKAGAVVIIPRAPMVPGHLYSVALEINRRRYQWSFRIAPSAPATTRPPETATGF